jgi:membrane-associated phospholipid phosphatase
VWILFPELRVVCAIGIITVDLGLVALNLHFLSDVVAGSFVGISTGLFTVTLWRASEPAMQGVKILARAEPALRAKIVETQKRHSTGID